MDPTPAIMRSYASLVVTALLAAILAGLAAAQSSNLVAPRPAIAPPTSLIPPDTDAVLSVNVDALLTSGLVRKHALEELKAGVAQNVALSSFLEVIDFDVFKDLQSLTLALDNPSSPSTLVIARGRFARGRIGIVLSLAASRDPEKVIIRRHRGATVYQLQGGDKPGYGALLGTSTMLLSERVELIHAAIARYESGRQSRDQREGQAGTHAELNPELDRALGAVDQKKSVWLAIGATRRVKEAMHANPDTKALAPSFVRLTGNLDVHNGLSLALELESEDGAALAPMHAQLSGVKNTLRQTAEAIPDYGTIGTDLVAGLTLRFDEGTLSLRAEVSGDTAQKISILHLASFANQRGDRGLPGDRQVRPAWDQAKAVEVVENVIELEKTGNAWDAIPWETDTQAAVVRAQREDKPLFVYFYVDKGGPTTAPC